VTQSEGNSFAQRSGRGGERGGRSVNGKSHDNLDKEYWKDTTCYKCEKKGKPGNKCHKNSNNDDDEEYVASATSSVKKIKKDFKSVKKAFTAVNTQLENLKEADLKMKTTSRIFKWMLLSNSRKWIRNLIQPSRIPSSKQVPRSRLTSGRSSYLTVSPLWIFSVIQPW
jgi:hypothetical protein